MTEGACWGYYFFLSLSPFTQSFRSPLLLAQRSSGARAPRRAALPSPPFPPSVSPRHRPGRRRGFARPGAGGEASGKGGPASQAPRLRLFSPGDGRLVRLVPLAGGAFVRRRPTDCPGAPGPGPPSPSSAPPTLFGPGAATARESVLVPASRCRRPPGLTRPVRAAAAAGSRSRRRTRRRTRRIRFHSVPALCLAPHDCGVSAATAFPAAACRRMAADREALTPVAQLLDSPPASPPCEPKQQSQQGPVSRLVFGATCQC